MTALVSQVSKLCDRMSYQSKYLSREILLWLKSVKTSFAMCLQVNGWVCVCLRFCGKINEHLSTTPAIYFCFYFFIKKPHRHPSICLWASVLFVVVMLIYEHLHLYYSFSFTYIYAYIPLGPVVRDHISPFCTVQTHLFCLVYIHKSSHTCTPRFSRPFLNTSPICTYFKIYPFRLHSSALYTLFDILISSRSFFYHAVTYLVSSI